MQDFSTSDARHDFTIDGARYYLPAVTFDDLRKISEFAAIEPAEQAVAFREFISSLARSHRPRFLAWLTFQKSPAKALSTLSIVQTTALFKEWVRTQGIKKFDAVGESSGSPS